MNKKPPQERPNENQDKGFFAPFIPTIAKINIVANIIIAKIPGTEESKSSKKFAFLVKGFPYPPVVDFDQYSKYPFISREKIPNAQNTMMTIYDKLLVGEHWGGSA